MSYPTDYKYTTEHEWVAADGHRATVGITDFAQHQLGDIVFVELPKPGDNVTAGQAFGTVESVKAVSEIFAPVSGSVVEVNAKLASAPELVNQDPHQSAWLIKVEMSNPEELKNLMSAPDYEKLVSEEKG
jgi:glycine cleavage system H protein